MRKGNPPSHLIDVTGAEVNSQDDVNFKKRMLELVEDGYIVFDKFGRWRVTEKGLTCLIACAERPVKISALHERNWKASFRVDPIHADKVFVFGFCHPRTVFKAILKSR
jgi:hypothetical protein